MVKKETWHSISMRNIHTIYHVDADTYFEIKRAMGDIDAVDVQIRFLVDIFNVMDNE